MTDRLRLKQPGDTVHVRYMDGFWYPARIEHIDGEDYVVRWIPPSPARSPYFRVHEDDVR